MLWQIKAPHFTAGIESKAGYRKNDKKPTLESKVIEAAPIVHYMIGWTVEQVREYCNKKKWQIQILK